MNWGMVWIGDFSKKSIVHSHGMRTKTAGCQTVREGLQKGRETLWLAETSYSLHQQ